MKCIKRFRGQDYGWVLDLTDAEASVLIDAATGDILLNEGAGEDRFHGGAISRSAFFRFCLNELGNAQHELVLEYGLAGRHVLGVTGEKEQADEWIEGATMAIRAPSRLQGLLARRPPFTIPEKCERPWRQRVCNSSRHALKFVIEPWRERYTMDPDACFDVVICGPAGEWPEFRSSDGAITLDVGKRSLVRSFVASLGTFRATTPSEIVEEELERTRRFGKFELSNVGIEALKDHLPKALDVFDVQLAMDPLQHKVALLSSSTIAMTLVVNACSEYRLKRETAWRVCARLLHLFSLRLEIYESVSDDLFTIAQTGGEEDVVAWLESHSWDGVTSVDFSLPSEADNPMIENVRESPETDG